MREKTDPQSQKVDPRRSVGAAARTPHRQHEVVSVEGREPDSLAPFELTADPTPERREGVETATRPVPAYLKGNPYRLSFASGDYTPPANERIDPRLLAAWRQTPTSGHTYGFVMFEGRITAARLARVRGLGVSLFNFHTFQSYSAKIPFAAVPELRASRDVRWIGYARPTQKVEDALARQIAAGGAARAHMFVTVFDSDVSEGAVRRAVTSPVDDGDPKTSGARATVTIPNGSFQRALERDGARVVSYAGRLRVFTIESELDSVAKFVRHDFVHSVELVPSAVAHHDRSTRQIGADAIRGSASTNGSSTVVGIIDTGAHMGGGRHIDLNKWGVGFDFLSSGGAFNDSNGHGTHVLGTMVGTGTANSRFRGVAVGVGGTSSTMIYNAKAIPNNIGAGLTAINALRNQWNTVPRPHVINNSWGNTGTNSLGFLGTDATSRGVDDASFYSGQLHVFSVGNSGGAFGNDVLKSALRPAVAKNAFAVASLYDYRGVDGRRRNRQQTSLSTAVLTADRIYAIEIDTTSSWPTLTLQGLTIRTRATANTTMDTYVYLANALGRPSGSPRRISTMDVGTVDKWYRTTFPDYSVAAGTKLFLCFKPRTGATVRFPAIGTTGTQEGYYRSNGTGAWLGKFYGRLAYQPLFKIEAGETLAYTGKGPTRDGRVKPNISAPGHWVTSCKTKTTNQYTDKTGTSMAAPHVTGVAASVMHHYPFLKYKPHRVKALLAATANPYRGAISTAMNSMSGYNRTGLGQVDAYRSNWSLDVWNGWNGGSTDGQITSSSSGQFFEFAVSPDADGLVVAMNFDERAPSASATRAAIADLDLYLDVEPFSAGMNTGEYSSRAAWDTWEWVRITSSTIMNSIRGKRVRVKIYPRVRPDSTSNAKWGVAYVVYRGDPTPTSLLSVTAPDAVKPNATFEVDALVTVPHNAATNVVVGVDPFAFTTTVVRHRNPEGLVRSWSSRTWAMLGNLGYWYDSLGRTATFELRNGTSGRQPIRFNLWSDNRGTLQRYQVTKQICVDGSLPPGLSGFASSTHPLNQWSRHNLTVQWNLPTDSGCAGVKGIATSVSLDNPANPPSINVNGPGRSRTVVVNSSAKKQYFNARVHDKADNISGRVSYGPFYVDKTKPTMNFASIASGAPYTNTLLVDVRASATDSYSGPDQMRYSANGSTWSAWMPYILVNRQINIGSLGGGIGQGTKTVYVQVRDKARNVSTSASDTIVYDSIKPSVPFVVINNGDAHTKSRNVSVTASSIDTGSGVVQMRYSTNNSSWTPWLSYTAASRPFQLDNVGQGVKSVYVQTRDRAGNESVAGSDQIIYDSLPPTITSVTINNGDSFTRTLLATVRTIAADNGNGSGLEHMRYSANGTTWSAWRPYASGAVPIALSSFGGNGNQGTKTVFVQVRDKAGNPGAPRSDTIVYDKTGPILSRVVINGGAPYTNSLAASVVATASDSTSNVADMRFSATGRIWSGWQKYSPGAVAVNLSANGGTTAEGSKSVFVQVRDGAGNESAPGSDSIIYDRTAPVVTAVVINNDAPFTNRLQATVSTTASDALSGPGEMRFSATGRNWSAWRPFSSTRVTVDLSANGGSNAQGAKTLYVQVRDRAQNVSASKSDAIVYDSIPPGMRSVLINAGAAFTKSLQAQVRTAASDAGSGLAQMRFSADDKTWSRFQGYAATDVAIDLSANGGNSSQGTKTVYVQVTDRAGNSSASMSDTIVYDSQAPVLSSVTLARGATYTSTLGVAVQLSATGAPAEMRHSANGATWSAWSRYSATFQADLSQNGGNPNTGTKTLHVQLRDAAQNTSRSVSDTIIYLKVPAITSLGTARVDVVNETRVVLTGTGLADVNRIRFGAATITSKLEDDWYSGYFRVVSDTRIELFTPQNVAVGSHDIVASNAGFSSGKRPIQVVHNTDRRLGVPARLARGKALNIVSHRSDMPASTLAVLTLSLSPRPLTVPGIVSLEHGGNPTSFIDPSFVILPGFPHDPSKRTARWTFNVPSSVSPATLYFEALLFNPLAPALPLPTTTMDSVRVY